MWHGGIFTAKSPKTADLSLRALRLAQGKLRDPSSVAGYCGGWKRAWNCPNRQEIATLARLWRGALRLAMTNWDFLPRNHPRRGGVYPLPQAGVKPAPTSLCAYGVFINGGDRCTGHERLRNHQIKKPQKTLLIFWSPLCQPNFHESGASPAGRGTPERLL
jgi:hypothetical protein